MAVEGVTVFLRPGADRDAVRAAVDELVQSLGGGGETLETSDAITVSFSPPGLAVEYDTPTGFILSGQASGLLAAARSLATAIWKVEGVTGAIIKVAVVGGTVAIAWQGFNFYFDQKRAAGIKAIIDDPSVPDDLKREAIEKLLQTYVRPPSIFDEMGKVVLMVGAVGVGALLLYWVLFKKPERSSGGTSSGGTF